MAYVHQRISESVSEMESLSRPGQARQVQRERERGGCLLLWSCLITCRGRRWRRRRRGSGEAGNEVESKEEGKMKKERERGREGERSFGKKDNDGGRECKRRVV